MLALFGILLGIVIPKLQIPQKACYTKLAHNLSNLQNHLSFFYTKATLSQSHIDQNKVFALIQSHHFESKNCFLGFEKSRFIAKAFSQKTTFSIEPNDLSVQPSFKCPFSSNALCREILNRTKTK